MIIGIGSDIVDIGRIESLMAEFGERFGGKYFTKEERNLAESREEAGLKTMTYAKRFAAKEACAKALGTGINHGVHLKDIGVTNDQNGQPALELLGGAYERLQELIPENHIPHIHLSLSDEPPYAQAFVIIEARPTTK